MPSQETTEQTQQKLLFPTLDSLQDVIELAKSKFPTEQHNDVLSIIFTYHNTLLAQVEAAKFK